MASAIFNVLKFIPASTAAKALGKVDKRFKNYFASAAAYGYDVDRAVNFLSGQFDKESEEQRLQNKATPTPEEGLALQGMQADKAIPRAMKTAASFATGGLLAGNEEEAPQQQAAPTPQQQLAQKVGNASNAIGAAERSYTGMATPVIAGRAIAQAQQAPHRLQAALKAKNGPQATPQAPQPNQTAGTPFDMLKRNSPEIGAFMESEMKKGRSPYEAAAAARAKKALQEPITKLEAQAQVPFEGIIAHIFGGNVPQEQEITPTQTVQGGDYRQDLKQLAALIQQYNNAKGAR